MPGTTVETRSDEKTALAPRWKVIVHDDPVTTFAFVEGVLRRVFAKSQGEAHRITLEAHRSGSALVDVLPLEQAEFRRDQAQALARAEGYPLTLTLEPD